MIAETNLGARRTGADSQVKRAEARGFEPRKGANPNRISSPVRRPEQGVRRCNPLLSMQARAAACRKTAQGSETRSNPFRAITVPSRAGGCHCC